MTHPSQEPFEIWLVYIAVTPIINCPKCLLDWIVIGVFKVALHQVNLHMQSYFLEDKLTQCSFNPHGQILKSWHVICRSLSDSRPEVGIVTGEQNLQEVMIVDHFVPIQVKIVNHLLKVFRLQFSIAVFPLELCQLNRPNKPWIVPINPLECCVGLKVSHWG